MCYLKGCLKGRLKGCLKCCLKMLKACLNREIYRKRMTIVSSSHTKKTIHRLLLWGNIHINSIRNQTWRVKIGGDMVFESIVRSDYYVLRRITVRYCVLLCLTVYYCVFLCITVYRVLLCVLLCIAVYCYAPPP